MKEQWGAGQALGQGGGRNVRDYLSFVIVTLFSLCANSSPLGKEVKQEKNLRASKKKQKQ